MDRCYEKQVSEESMILKGYKSYMFGIGSLAFSSFFMGLLLWDPGVIESSALFVPLKPIGAVVACGRVAPPRISRQLPRQELGQVGIGLWLQSRL